MNLGNCTLSILEGNDTVNFYYSIDKSWNVDADLVAGYTFSSGYANAESDSLVFTEILGNKTLDTIDYSFSLYMLNHKTLIVPDSVYCFGIGDTLIIKEK